MYLADALNCLHSHQMQEAINFRMFSFRFCFSYFKQFFRYTFCIYKITKKSMMKKESS